MKFTAVLAVILLATSFAGEFTVDVQFDPEEVTMGSMAGYTSVTMHATPSLGRIGFPALPVASTPVALPAGTRRCQWRSPEQAGPPSGEDTRSFPQPSRYH